MGSRGRRKDARHRTTRAATTQRGGKRPRWFLVVLALAASAAVIAVVMKSREADPPQAAPAGDVEPKPVTAPVVAPAPDKLVERWRRTDGDYALDVRRVERHGAAEVTYANPGPINVSRAEVNDDAGQLVLFVELRDVNYPGSTYRLTYQPDRDALVGSYHQPALGETYDVEFHRAE